MIVRAGALDQGNVGLNLAEAERRGITEKVLFLAGSAINSIRNEKGEADPKRLCTTEARRLLNWAHGRAIAGDEPEIVSKVWGL